MIKLVETAVHDGLIPHKEFELLKRAHIVELTDVIRVLLMYNAGGIYMDLDRLINIPLDELVGKADHRPSISPQSQIPNPKMVCLTNQDHHFMQDIMVSSKCNRLYKEVLNRMTRQRLKLPRKGGWLSRQGLFSLGGPMYLNTLDEMVFGPNHSHHQTATKATRTRTPAMEHEIIQGTSNGLIKTGRYGYCDGDTINPDEPIDDCQNIKRTSLYEYFNLMTPWTVQAQQRWNEVDEYD